MNNEKKTTLTEDIQHLVLITLHLFSAAPLTFIAAFTTKYKRATIFNNYLLQNFKPLFKYKIGLAIPFMNFSIITNSLYIYFPFLYITVLEDLNMKYIPQ